MSSGVSKVTKTTTYTETVYFLYDELLQDETYLDFDRCLERRKCSWLELNDHERCLVIHHLVES